MCAVPASPAAGSGAGPRRWSPARWSQPGRSGTSTRTRSCAAGTSPWTGATPCCRVMRKARDVMPVTMRSAPVRACTHSVGELGRFRSDCSPGKGQFPQCQHAETSGASLPEENTTHQRSAHDPSLGAFVGVGGGPRVAVVRVRSWCAYQALRCCGQVRFEHCHLTSGDARLERLGPTTGFGVVLGGACVLSRSTYSPSRPSLFAVAWVGCVCRVGRSRSASSGTGPGCVGVNRGRGGRVRGGRRGGCVCV